MKKDPNVNQLAERVKSLIGGLRNIDPTILASHTGTMYTTNGDGKGKFEFSFWGKQVSLTYPDFNASYKESGESLPLPFWAMIAYYFVTSNGSPLAGKWVSFSELPDGRFYNQAFQGYTGRKISRAFLMSSQDFERAAQAIGGSRITFGDIAYKFKILPKVELSVVCWIGDEDFPTSYQVLFDASIVHHLPTDACAVLGSMLTGKLIKAKGESQ
ncbi:MAG: DUF3786 domain-containing protein [Anaerolineales bacterium]